MKIPVVRCLILFLGVLLAASCSYVEITPVGEADRVLTGKVSYLPSAPVAEGAILSVRIVDSSNTTSGPVLLGQQRIPISGEPPFEFRAEYRAEDGLMRRGVTVDAKILVNGKVRYTSMSGHFLTLGRAGGSQEIMLSPIAP